MRTIKPLGTLIFSIAVALAGGLHAQTLVTNIKGYSFHHDSPARFSAVSFQDDKITGVYQTVPDNKQFAQIIDGKGATLVPGMIDAHGHVLGYGQALNRVVLNGATSKDEALERVAQFIAGHKDNKWIRGRGWNQELWPDRAFPDAEALSKISSGKLVALGRIDGHALWVNQEVLQLAGINKDTPSPEGGEIIKDAQGNPTGILIDNAMNLVYSLIPEPGIAEVKQDLLTSLNKLASLGLTSVHDAGIDYLTWQAYQELSLEGKLPIRVYVMLDVTDRNYAKMLQKGHIYSEDGKLVIRSVKISSDGALGSRGAALHEEYSDKPGHFGLLLHDIPNLNKLTLQAMQAEFQVNTHAIGDKANTVSLDAFAQAIKQTQSQELRHRIEHAQVIHPDDFKRFQAFNIIASVQPTHATSDKNMAEDRLGSERIKGAYAWQRLLSNNALLAGGSDFPIEPAEPLFGIHAAVTRQDRHNQPEGGWYATEGVSLHQAFHMFTLGAAYAAHQENSIGSIEPGKKADFVLLQKDPLAIAPEQLWKIPVLQTWVNGELVWQK
ncbi:amidohydrolase [Planctobacterium marinum]|uniref:Amidohydrolase n=1 Tax=Planctobacterium marinum TaxID=1631968 RepID=A0AA48KN29_9ALTE|nr:amidohydrolase [Planctobacterium marinum]